MQGCQLTCPSLTDNDAEFSMCLLFLHVCQYMCHVCMCVCVYRETEIERDLPMPIFVLGGLLYY